MRCVKYLNSTDTNANERSNNERMQGGEGGKRKDAKEQVQRS
jgi:hypothetical protein